MAMKEFQEIHESKGKRFLFKVEDSLNPRDYVKYEELRYEIWGDPNDSLAGTRNMICENYFHDGNCLFIGAYVENEKGNFLLTKDHLVGFSYGFVGVRNKSTGFRTLQNILFYSQYTGVKSRYQNYGLGIKIKEFQKKILKGLFGIHKVTCTFDPLTGVNAYRNIHHFGMKVVEYREACYEDFAGNLNRPDIPCDRFFIEWDLDKKVRRPAYDLGMLLSTGFLALSGEMQPIKGRKGAREIAVAGEIRLDLEHEFVLVEIPVDFYSMLKQTDVVDESLRHIPFDWRMKTRKVFQELFSKKYKVIDFRKEQIENRIRDFYVLRR